MEMKLKRITTEQQNKKTILTVCEGTRGKDLWKKVSFQPQAKE